MIIYKLLLFFIKMIIQRGISFGYFQVIFNYHGVILLQHIYYLVLPNMLRVDGLHCILFGCVVTSKVYTTKQVSSLVSNQCFLVKIIGKVHNEVTGHTCCQAVVMKATGITDIF